jgi:hypothetical protein
LIEGEHATFLLIDDDHYQSVMADAESSGLSCVYCEPLPDPLKPPYITDYTWNHGTLWAIKADPVMTYLQCGYGSNFAEQMDQLRDRFPGEIFQHLEWTARTSAVSGQPLPDDIGVGGLPKIVFKSPARLQEIIDYCDEIGVGVANPHSCYLEEGGRQPNIALKRQMKDRFDPKGLLNPGKMKTYDNNPFRLALSA